MKILHIDDTENILNSFAKILPLYNHDIVSCTDGKTGLRIISEQKFDIIFLDLAMPHFSGFDVLNELEKLKLTIPPIFVFTAMTLNDAEKSKILKQGVKKIIPKPIELENLILELNNFRQEVIIFE